MATVRSGDNLSKIARQYGLDVRDLIAANPQLANPNLIRPGQKINIPDGPVSAAERNAAGNFLASVTPGMTGYVTQTGQTAPTVAGTTKPTAPAIAAATAAGSAVPGLAAYLRNVRAKYGAAFNATLGTPITPSNNVLGRAFPRELATLTPQGTVSARAAAMRQRATVLTQAQQAAMAASGGYNAAGRGTNRLSSVSAGAGLTFAQQAAISVGRATPEQFLSPAQNVTQASQQATPSELQAGATREIGGKTYVLTTDPAGNRIWKAQGTAGATAFNTQSELSYLDSIRGTQAHDEYIDRRARFGGQSLGVTVANMERALNEGLGSPTIATERVFDLIVQRNPQLGYASGADMLKDLGYIPVEGPYGEGVWQLINQPIGGTGSMGAGLGFGGGSGGTRGGGVGGGSFGGLNFGNASAGLYNWRIGA